MLKAPTNLNCPDCGKSMTPQVAILPKQLGAAFLGWFCFNCANKYMLEQDSNEGKDN